MVDFPQLSWFHPWSLCPARRTRPLLGHWWPGLQDPTMFPSVGWQLLCSSKTQTSFLLAWLQVEAIKIQGSPMETGIQQHLPCWKYFSHPDLKYFPLTLLFEKLRAALCGCLHWARIPNLIKLNKWQEQSRGRERSPLCAIHPALCHREQMGEEGKWGLERWEVWSDNGETKCPQPSHTGGGQRICPSPQNPVSHLFWLVPS